MVSGRMELLPSFLCARLSYARLLPYILKPVFRGACFEADSAPILYAPYTRRIRPCLARIGADKIGAESASKHAPWKTGFSM